MLLKLEVVGAEAGRLGERRSKVFAAEGGTIGRVDGNDWVLPDQYVSSHHAAIRFVDGQFFVIDTNSSNGVFLNAPGCRLEQGRPYAIKTGDRLLIDPFEIHVSVLESGVSRGASVPEPPETADRRRPSVTPQPAPPLSRPTPRSDPFAVVEEVPYIGTLPVNDQRAAHSDSLIPDSALDSESPVDPLVALGLPEARKKSPGPRRAEELAGGSPLRSHFEPPRVIPAKPPDPVVSLSKPELEPAPLIPPNYDPLIQTGFETDAVRPVPRPDASGSRPKLKLSPVQATPPPKPVAPPPPRPIPRQVPSTPPPAIPKSQPAAQERPVVPPPVAPGPPRDMELQVAPRAAADTRKTLDFAALLAAAGLEGVPITPELSASFGSILKVVIDGLRDVLRAREELKEQFRMRITTYQPRENNPIKFSANTEDALHNLLVKRNSAYLEPLAAFEEAFEDLRFHQMAMVAGLRAAYEAMLRHFDPHTLESKFERYVKRGGGLLSGSAKQRYWELYCESFADVMRDPDSGFQSLFGEAFCRAYEEQARLLKMGALDP